MNWPKPSRPKEVAVQKKLLNELKKIGFVRKLSDRWNSGIPDILLIADGYAIFIELKRNKKSKASPTQLATIEAINKNGGYGFVAHSFEEAMECVRSVLD